MSFGILIYWCFLHCLQSATSEVVQAVKGREMGTEEPRDPLQGVDWKAVGNDMQKNPGDKPGIKKRLPRKIRQIPECYFLPRRSRLYNFTFVSACIASGIGAGMLVEMWINKKVRGAPFCFHVRFFSLW